MMIVKRVFLFLFIMISSVCYAQVSNVSIDNSVKEEANRKLVLTFYDTFFNKHQVDVASLVIDENYKQHNPSIPDGKEPFVSFFKIFFKKNPNSKAKVIKSAVSGDVVWLHVHSTNDDLGEAVVDIFRVKDGKIVEHWDVIQKVPEQSENKNTMF